jgi:NAD(P)-dependent dehydrogenase (short-subunit alcohol dehydrogenase family)
MNKTVYPDLAGKIAVVTGANGGIGQATVRALAEQGVQVVATDINPSAVFDIATSVHYRMLDVTSVGALHTLADDVVSQHGKLDIWVNNAGTLSRSPALELSAEAWQTTFDINLKGTFFGAQAAARHMAKAGTGAIINLSSYAGVKARPNCADYAAAKAGVAHLTQCLSLEWSPLGIRVNAIAPGYIETPMSSWMHADPQAYQVYMERTPARRLGQPDEIAATVAYLASESASYVTGHVMMVDGGISLA